MNILEFRNVVVPMFQTPTETAMTEQNDSTASTNQNEISIFDVKALYDAAYEIKDKGHENSAHEFKEALSKAVQMDMEYRRQLSRADIFARYTSQRPSPALTKHKETQTSKGKAA